MAMELKGKVIQILPTQTGMGKKGQWKKLEFIVETQAQYPRKCVFPYGEIRLINSIWWREKW